jgi:hypothetical protein
MGEIREGGETVLGDTTEITREKGQDCIRGGGVRTFSPKFPPVKCNVVSHLHRVSYGKRVVVEGIVIVA